MSNCLHSKHQKSFTQPQPVAIVSTREVLILKILNDDDDEIFIRSENVSTF